MKKNSTEEATTFILQSRPSLHQSLSFYIVKNALINDIIITNVHSTFVIIVIDEHRDTEYLTVLTGIIEVGDFNHSGGYCYELFSSLTCAYHALTFSFHLRSTCILLKADMPSHICLPPFYLMYYMCSPQGKHLSSTYLSQ